MEVKQAVISRRTRRKFTAKKVSHQDLLKLIEYARFAPMGANIQGLKYMLIEDDELVERVFEQTKWSGYHIENAPTKEEQPRSYIAMLGDTEIKKNGNFETDAGAAGTIILLGAEDLGLASCWLGAINREEIAKIINLDERYKLLYLIAIGYSDQKATTVDADGDIKYYTDEKGVLTVPKRLTKDLIVE